MTLTEFLNKNCGKKVDFDGAYGAQCVDLFRQFAKDVLKIPEHTGAVNGAKELFTKYSSLPKEKQYFHKFAISEIVCGDTYLIPGDVAIFDGTSTNPYGHVAIVVSSNGQRVIVFEQDGFKQDGAKFAEYDTRQMLGVLRRK